MIQSVGSDFNGIASKAIGCLRSPLFKPLRQNILHMVIVKEITAKARGGETVLCKF